MSKCARQCPSCEHLVLPADDVDSVKQGFPCPICGAVLEISVANLDLTVVVSLALASVCCFCFGVRGYVSIAFVLTSSLPLAYFVNAGLVVFFPPPFKKVERTGQDD